MLIVVKNKKNKSDFLIHIPLQNNDVDLRYFNKSQKDQRFKPSVGEDMGVKIKFEFVTKTLLSMPLIIVTTRINVYMSPGVWEQTL